MCYQPFGVYGAGHNDLLRYSYDLSNNQCKTFLWSGIQADHNIHVIENRFMNLVDCENTCMV